MGWQWKWQDPQSGGQNKGGNRGRQQYTELQKLPWVCTAQGCTQTKNWNMYTTCKSCGATRLTAPFTELPQTKTDSDMQSKIKLLEERAAKAEAQNAAYKAAAASEGKDTPMPQAVPTEDISDDDSDDEITTEIALDLEKLVGT